MKKLWLASFAIAGLMSMSQAEAVKDMKDIHVVPAPVQNYSSSERAYYDTTSGSLFSFVKMVKSTVYVGEPIRISLKLRKKAYVYLIAVSNRSNRAYMINPNSYAGYNLYRAHSHYVVPENSAKYRFISDAPGTETLYVIASTYKQNFDQLLNQFGKKEIGGFRTSSAKSATSYVKDILVVPARQNNATVEVRRLHVNVR